MYSLTLIFSTTPQIPASAKLNVGSAFRSESATRSAFNLADGIPMRTPQSATTERISDGSNASHPEISISSTRCDNMHMAAKPIINTAISMKRDLSALSSTGSPRCSRTHASPPCNSVNSTSGMQLPVSVTAVIVLLFSRSILCRDMPSASKRLTIFSGRMHLILILTYPRVNFHKNIYLSAAPISFYFSLQNDVFESFSVPADRGLQRELSYSTAAISPVHTTVCLSAQQILSSVPAMLSIPSAVCSRTFESENSSTPR